MTITEARRQWAVKKLSQCTAQELEVLKIMMIEDDGFMPETIKILASIAGIENGEYLAVSLVSKGVIFYERQWDNSSEERSFSLPDYCIVNEYRKWFWQEDNQEKESVKPDARI